VPRIRKIVDAFFCQQNLIHIERFQPWTFPIYQFGKATILLTIFFDLIKDPMKIQTNNISS